MGSLLESTGAFLTILTPLVAVPLTVITFYLRSLREHQVSWHAELVRRVESIENAAADLRKALTEFERDYTTKEEWLRECMLARQSLAQLTEAAVRMETMFPSGSARMDPASSARTNRTRPVGVSPAEQNQLANRDEDQL